MHLTLGSICDYHALAHHHYRAHRPATITRILALRDERPTVVSRFLQQRATHRTIAVLVESMPTLNCQLRNLALNNRYSARPERSRGRDLSSLTRRQRIALLNAEVRCISRVIVHPQYRSLGLAVQLVRAALDSATTRYTEAIAAMGAVHPFFEKAGMTAYRRPPHPFDDRLRAALQSIHLDPIMLACLDIAANHIASLTPAQQRFIDHELATWFRRTRHTQPPPTRTEQLRAARQHLLCEPVYYIAENQRFKMQSG